MAELADVCLNKLPSPLSCRTHTLGLCRHSPLKTTPGQQGPELVMTQRRTPAVGSEPHFLQFNDLACETVGGKVSPDMQLCRHGDAEEKS